MVPERLGNLFGEGARGLPTVLYFPSAAESVFGSTSVVVGGTGPLRISAILVYKKGDAKFRGFR